MLNFQLTQQTERAESKPNGFTIMEVLVAVLVMTTICVAFYLGLSTCFSVIKTSREDVRATQIMMQKIEAVRLCTWSELASFTFKEPYDPTGSTNNGLGVYYYGRVTKGPPMLSGSASYSNNMCMVTVDLVWTNGGGTSAQVFTRQMQTHYSRYGLQSYIWGVIQ